MKRVVMGTLHRPLRWLSLVVALAGCGGGSPPPTAASPTAASPTAAVATTPADPSPTSTARDITELERDAQITPGAYFIHPDAEASPLRVDYTVAADGWQEWAGGLKFDEEEDGHVVVTITTVENLVRDGCSDHAPADPPVGPSVDDLATALAELPPFQVTSPPTDVTVDGYQGEHLELTVPEDLPADNDGSFTGCIDQNLHSWLWIPTGGVLGAFYGYSGPGYTEEFSIVDVEGTRLMIAAGRSAHSPVEDLAELRAVLDSIQITP